MSTSIKIRKNINMSSKNIVFKGAETGKFAKSHVGKRPKVNMGKAIKLALNSIPATNVVTGDIFQIAKMNMVKRILGSISVVAGSQELFKPENLGENTERNFGENVYHKTSGVHEETRWQFVSVEASIKEVKVKGAVSGWEEINGKWKYHDVTKYAKGWNKIDGKWYYFGSDEYMVTGWHSIGGNIYYFKAKKDVEGESGYGYMWEGWRKIDGKWYYFKKEKDVEGESGYGYVWKDWRKIGNKWYYFKSDGEMVASQMIESSNGKRYYLGADGAMVTSQTVNWEGKEYQVDSEGVCSEKNDVDAKIEKFMSSAELIGNWYTKNVNTYLSLPEGGDRKDYPEKRKKYYCDIINQEVEDDCSSYVSNCLMYMGYIDYNGYESKNFNPNLEKYSKGLGKKLNESGFVWHNYTKDYIPKRGDILVQHNGCKHIEIVDSYTSGNVGIWSWGKVYDSLPATRTETNFRERTSGYWRIEN